MQRKKLFAILGAVLALLLTAGAVCAAVLRSPEKAEGSYYRGILDRVNVEVSPTRFVFASPEAQDETLVCELTLKLSKTEGDFYGKLLDLDVEGLDYDALQISDETGGGTLSKNGAFLPVDKDGAPQPLTLRLTLTFPRPETQVSPVLSLHLLSGMSEGTADERFLEIPLEFVFTE